MPVSNTTRLALGARMRITSDMTLGSKGHLPRQTRLPPLQIEMAVSFKETSRPIKSSMVAFRSMHGPDHHVVSPFFHPRGATTP
jgi:hypothetical protein